MAQVGDRIQVPSMKVGQVPREGVVTAVIGGLLRVQWSTGEESTFTPSMGSLAVVGRSRSRSVAKKAPAARKPAAKKATAVRKPAAKKTARKPAAKKAPAARKTARKPAAKKAPAARKPAAKTAKAKRASGVKTTKRSR